MDQQTRLPSAATAGPSIVYGSDDASPALPPLVVSGLVVTKEALIAALRPYVPQLTDLTVLEGERFLLRLGGGSPPATAQQERKTP